MKGAPVLSVTVHCEQLHSRLSPTYPKSARAAQPRRAIWAGLNPTRTGSDLTAAQAQAHAANNWGGGP